MAEQSSPTRPGHHAAAALEFRNVTKTYPGADRPVLVDLSFEVPAGEICVLVGPSGCGKTTAMRMVNRMIDITDGDILLDGQSVRRRDPAELRRHIGYVIQQIGLFPHLSVGDNIATVPRLLGWERKRVDARVTELLELISLPAETRERYPAEISGGQRQRVGVARALAADPPLMLMDEPFGAIDPITRERLQDEFLRLQQDIRKTIVFVTHDIDEAIKMGDRIAIMREGGVLAQFDTPERILAEPADDFVARFVGLDRGLKRLSLSKLSDLRLESAEHVPDGTPAPSRSDRSRVVFVDGNDRPVGRLGLDGEPEPVGPTGDPETSLRDALSLIMSDGNRPLVVVDTDGATAGLVRLDVIAGALAVGNGTDAQAEAAHAPAEVPDLPAAGDAEP
jgi:osmoprotectant transport system ATP-binding protein